METLASTVGWLLSPLAFVVELFFSIPVIGRIIKWIWNLVLSIVAFAVSVFDFVLSMFGIRPEKKLRVCVIVMTDPQTRQPVAGMQQIVDALQEAIDVYYHEANIRIIPSAPFKYTSGFAKMETASEDWVHIYNESTAPGPVDVKCEAAAFSQDIGTKGGGLEYIACTKCFYGNARRVLGYGSPVIVFAVRSIDPQQSIGCSIGPLSDYITVLGSNPVSIGHEIGHACNLFGLWGHLDDPENLMVEVGRPGRDLRWWQVSMLRTSRHITYL